MPAGAVTLSLTNFDVFKKKKNIVSLLITFLDPIPVVYPAYLFHLLTFAHNH